MMLRNLSENVRNISKKNFSIFQRLHSHVVSSEKVKKKIGAQQKLQREREAFQQQHLVFAASRKL